MPNLESLEKDEQKKSTSATDQNFQSSVQTLMETQVKANRSLTPDYHASLLNKPGLSNIQRQSIAHNIGRTHGNRYLQRVLDAAPGQPQTRHEHDIQRGIMDVIEGIGEFGEDLQDRLTNAVDPIASIFQVVIDTNVAMASSIAIPQEWRQKVMAFSAANPTDGALMIPALMRFPTFHRGGWIMDVQPNAAAMTLDRNIFVTGQLSLTTFAHELTHVTQYATLGRSAFLVSYFGLSALEIARRFVMREPIDMMQSSPHENQAYELGSRFRTWHTSEHGSDSNGIQV